MENREIEQRIEWISARVPLDALQKTYIRFQMKEQNKDLLYEIEMLKFELKAAGSVNEQLQKELETASENAKHWYNKANLD